MRNYDTGIAALFVIYYDDVKKGQNLKMCHSLPVGNDFNVFALTPF